MQRTLQRGSKVPEALAWFSGVWSCGGAPPFRWWRCQAAMGQPALATYYRAHQLLLPSLRGCGRAASCGGRGLLLCCHPSNRWHTHRCAVLVAVCGGEGYCALPGPVAAVWEVMTTCTLSLQRVCLPTAGVSPGMPATGAQHGYQRPWCCCWWMACEWESHCAQQWLLHTPAVPPCSLPGATVAELGVAAPMLCPSCNTDQGVYGVCRLAGVTSEKPPGRWWRRCWHHHLSPDGCCLNVCCCMGHRSLCPVDKDSSDGKVHGTRKVVNYTVPWWSHGKLWWKSVAVLTCKLCSLSAAWGCKANRTT